MPIFEDHKELQTCKGCPFLVKLPPMKQRKSYDKYPLRECSLPVALKEGSISESNHLITTNIENSRQVPSRPDACMKLAKNIHDKMAKNYAA